jgi:hypothetical protein
VRKGKIMQQLGLNEESDMNVKKGFWRRQFQKEATKSQKIFDWIFGVIMPVVCFAFDPVVFKGNAMGTAYLADYKPFAYILSFVSVMAMAAWLIWGAKLKWLGAFLAGLFFVGGTISLGIGVILFPISLLGLLILIGVLGFTPLFSSLVYLRNSLRAYESARPFLEKRVLANSFFLSLILSTVIPSISNVQIKKAVDEMKGGDVRTIRAKAQSLKYFAFLANLDGLALRYQRAEPAKRETEEMKAIAEAFKELTGEDIKTKTQVLFD